MPHFDIERLTPTDSRVYFRGRVYDLHRRPSGWHLAGSRFKGCFTTAYRAFLYLALA